MDFSVSLLRTLDAVDAPSWDALAGADFPFADHAHLVALERAGCVGAQPGWLPFVAAARSEDGNLVGALSFYLKDNSYGEFIFDHGWARAYASHGIEYFPKLVVAVPFTPATGQKVLAAGSGEEALSIRRALLGQALAVAQATRCSTAHVLFVPASDVASYATDGWIVRHSFQYHWFNRGYADFDAFLSVLTKKRRKQIALERRQLCAEPDLSIETIEGDALTSEHARLVTASYLDTNARYGSLACLNEAFFTEVFRSMKDNVVLFVARRGAGEPVAIALNFRKGARLFGRYWGCTEEIRNLHFELCYYRAIDYCIRHGLEAYEAGAQGEHKIPRGFEPTLTYSAHKVFHPAFEAAIARSVEDEKVGIARLFEEFAEHSPFKGDVS